MREFIDPSPIAKEEAPRPGFKAKYSFPFDSVPVGKSFCVAHDEVKNVNVLRTITRRAELKHKRKFRVIDHGPKIGYEVYHVGELKE